MQTTTFIYRERFCGPGEAKGQPLQVMLQVLSHWLYNTPPCHCPFRLEGPKTVPNRKDKANPRRASPKSLLMLIKGTDLEQMLIVSISMP